MIQRALVCLLLFASIALGADRPPANGVVSLDVVTEGDAVHMLLVDKRGAETAKLLYQRSLDGGETWSAPVQLGQGQTAPDGAHRGMDAQLACAKGRAVAVWTTYSETDRFGRGPLASAISDDGGKTWRAGPNPADDGEATGHAFIDIAADANGAFHLVWLDGRRIEKGKGLRYAQSTDGGKSWSPNQTVDQQTCECCWNAIGVASDGRTYVLFRDASPRDMAVSSSADNGKTWSSSSTAGAFGWEINACPHVGGGLAVSESNSAELCALVWTAKDETTRGLYALHSIDAGQTWTNPTRLGSPRALHADIACHAGKTVAVWDAWADDAMAVFASTSSDHGATWSQPLRLSESGRTATHPRVVFTSAGARAFWTEQQSGSPVAWVARKVD